MKPDELARLIQDFYNQWERDKPAEKRLLGKIHEPSLFDFAQWLESRDTGLNKRRKQS